MHCNIQSDVKQVLSSKGRPEYEREQPAKSAHKHSFLSGAPKALGKFTEPLPASSVTSISDSHIMCLLFSVSLQPSKILI